MCNTKIKGNHAHASNVMHYGLLNAININGDGNYYIPCELLKLLLEKDRAIKHKDMMIHDLFMERTALIMEIVKNGGKLPKFKFTSDDYYDSDMPLYTKTIAAYHYILKQ